MIILSLPKSYFFKLLDKDACDVLAKSIKKMIYCLFKLDIYLFDYVYAP